jgi:hypothetical protein
VPLYSEKHKKPRKGGGPFKPKAVEEPHPQMSIQALWREVEQLRTEVKELRASQFPPRFCSFDADGISAGAKYFKCGFQPYAVFAIANLAAGSVITQSTGFAVFDEEIGNTAKIYQACTAIRGADGANLFRTSSNAHFGVMLQDNNSVADWNAVMDSFDHDGFSYTVNAPSGVMTSFRGMVIGR